MRSAKTETVPFLVCDGCGARIDEQMPGKYGTPEHANLVAAHFAGWKWCRGYAARTHHYCPRCVSLGKYDEFFRHASERPTALARPAEGDGTK